MRNHVIISLSAVLVLPELLFDLKLARAGAHGCFVGAGTWDVDMESRQRASRVW